MDKAVTTGTDNPLLDELGQPRAVLEKLTPEEYEGLQHAYMEGGDKGALDFLENVLSDKYVENWNIDYLTGLGFDGVGPHDNDGDPRAFH